MSTHRKPINEFRLDHERRTLTLRRVSRGGVTCRPTPTSCNSVFFVANVNWSDHGDVDFERMAGLDGTVIINFASNRAMPLWVGGGITGTHKS